METTDAPACRPNISPRGRMMRRRFGAVMLVAAVAALAGMAWFHARWPFRALVFLPLTAAGFGLLQATRNTCVARAREGTFEHDDFSKVAAPDDEVIASRAVARTIERDALLLGLLGAAVSVATAFVF